MIVYWLKRIHLIIMTLNPGLNDTAKENLRNDFKFVLNPTYTHGQSNNQIFNRLQNKLFDGRNNPKSKSGKSMEWLNELYAPLNIELTIMELKKEN